MVLLILASCGASEQTGSQMSGEGPVENTTVSKFALISGAFADGQAIPTQYTCDGADQPPPLSWAEPPAGTRSFALIVDDPDAPSGTFRHWGAFDIPASTRTVASGQGGAFPQAVNDFGKAHYGGPCPPRGHGPHRYRFKLLALDVAQLDVGASPKITEVEARAGQHLLGQAQLIGTYERA